ncbi:carboxypeptidase-like regulatory domain-containing protein [Lentiprolixibacter aurantiacus]|uniref:TonB-dependent receptor n=1 Tax=Lentiprolixibacter aurantiacus TaxID=2993939 RepID=A0AAE3MIR9_9FLAO|nr:carboxypeptidase-like regulatory domain-containing protein [Lentiprolixibacter aurantiacus]MCX2718316.1 TonB-dependent receptor [Lentiprolixibacter aurantiacus]
MHLYFWPQGKKVRANSKGEVKVKKGWSIQLWRERKRTYCLLFLFTITTSGVISAQGITVKGVVLDANDHKEIDGVRVYTEGNLQGVRTAADGTFELNIVCLSDCLLQFDKTGYHRLRLPLERGTDVIDLGSIMLSRQNPVEKRDVLLNLSESDLNEEDGVSDVVGFLQGSRDIFLNRAAFDFSQSFFRIRGYDSSEGLVHINGLPMNSLTNGRPQWNNWGGLNDVMRYATRSLNLDISRTSFEGLLGGVDFTVRPSQMRPGSRITASFSNRSYATRLMGTFASGSRDGPFSFALSLSRRWAEEGFIQGTSYNAYSLFGSMELQLGPYSSIYGFAMLASNRRGRSAPVTEEVFDLAGRAYNPYWGFQGGRIRNSRERLISEPVLMLNFQLKRERLRLRLGLGYQFGEQASSRLGYFEAPNPDPTYYRYLPSFYYNNRFGDYSISAQNAAAGFRSYGQLSWENLYRANSNSPTGKASYLDYSEVEEGQQLIAGANANLKLSKSINLDAGISYRDQYKEYFSRIDDLLGAQYHLDIDPFSGTANDINRPEEKGVGDRFGYSYSLGIKAIKAFAQVEFLQRKWSTFISGGWESRDYQRQGLFLNARYPEESFGPSPVRKFSGSGIKAGIAYYPNSRIQFNLRGTSQQRLPLPGNLYINQRDNQKTVSYKLLPVVKSVEMNAHLRFPRLTGRASWFSTWFSNTTDIGFFYTDSGLGSDFVQEVQTNINTWHRGLEFGLEYAPGSSVTLSLAGTMASYKYVNNPLVSLYFDVTEADQNPIHPSGRANLGPAKLKELYMPRGPQQAISLGFTYRDPDFWFVSATVNQLNMNFIDLSVLSRTDSFLLDPETRDTVRDIDEDFLKTRLRQEPLPGVFLLNLVGGKSWLIKGHYLGIFASVNNLFDTTFRTGGFEQSRNGHYMQYIDDERSLTPSFAPKYWYGYGRTYFLNISMSF